MISDNNEAVEVIDIIAFYDQLDRKLFDDIITHEIVISEKDSYADINEIINQNLYLAQSKASNIITGILVNPFKRIAIKVQRLSQYENALSQLEEFRIHNKINKNFPHKCLELITPVQISKENQVFDIVAYTERGECNLYEYSRVIPINQEQAYSIFKEILIQIANLHSINIAHRDVKPQNIFYVKNKGWLLSDFGESQEYDKVQSKYTLRGTLYFLMPKLRSQIYKAQLIEQNLLANDLYALVVTITVILNFNYILDIHSKIKELQDPILLQCLNIVNFKELELFIQTLITNEMPFQWNEKFNTYHQPFKYKFKEILLEKSLLGIEKHNKLFKLQPSCLEQLLLIIKDKCKLSFPDISPHLFKELNYFEILNDNSRIIPLFKLKNLCKASIHWQQIALDCLLTRGYIEKPIKYSQQFLKQQYDQKIHLQLIKSLHRAHLYEEVNIQLKLFNSGLKFDHLDNDLQYDYMPIVECQKGIIRSEIQDFIIEKVLTQIQSCFDKVNFVLEANQISTIIMGMQDQFNKFDFHKCAIFDLLENELGKQPIYIEEHIILNIFNFNETQNFITRSKQAGDLGLLYILQNKFNKIYTNYQRLKQLLFNSESDFQAIIFQIQIIKLQLLEQQCTKKFTSQQVNQKINYIKDSIKKLQNCKIQIYLIHTVINLLSLIHNLFSYQNYQSPSLIFIIDYTLHSISRYEMIYQEELSYYHQLAFQILMKLRNYRRCRGFVINYDKKLSLELKTEYISILLERQNCYPLFLDLSPEQRIIQARKQQFIKWQYILR